MIKVLVADDHEAVRSGLTLLLEATGDMRVVSTCGDGDQVGAACAATRPDVVVMDLRMPRVDGLTASRRLLETSPGSRVLILTASADEHAVQQARGAGCRGLLAKGRDPAELLVAIRDVAAGRTAWRTATGAPLRATPGGSP